MKRFVASMLAIALAFCFSFSTTGCGKAKDEPKKETAKTPEDKEKAFTFEKDGAVEITLKKDGEKFKGEATVKLSGGKKVTEAKLDPEDAKVVVTPEDKGVKIVIVDGVNADKEYKIKVKGKNEKDEDKESTITLKVKKAA